MRAWKCTHKVEEEENFFFLPLPSSLLHSGILFLCKWNFPLSLLCDGFPLPVSLPSTLTLSCVTEAISLMPPSRLLLILCVTMHLSYPISHIEILILLFLLCRSPLFSLTHYILSHLFVVLPLSHARENHPSYLASSLSSCASIASWPSRGRGESIEKRIEKREERGESR